MNYFDSKITIEIVSLDDTNIQQELERISYEKYLRDDSIERNYFNKLLNSAGYSLSNNKFDQIVSYCLENNVYELSQVNEYLYTFCSASL